MNSFVGKLLLEYDAMTDPLNPYLLADDFGFFTELTRPFPRLIKAKKGYRTDFASVPRFFWRILPPHGKYAPAAVIHDWLCDEEFHSVDHILAADIFDEAMEECGVPRWKRRLMVWAVKHFGPKFDAHEVEAGALIAKERREGKTVQGL